jgi:hypothetical protein
MKMVTRTLYSDTLYANCLSCLLNGLSAHRKFPVTWRACGLLLRLAYPLLPHRQRSPANSHTTTTPPPQKKVSNPKY